MTDPTAELRAFSGQATRERPILEQARIAPWGGRVMVTPLRLSRARSTSSFDAAPEIEFEVIAEWVGDPMPGALPSDEPVQSRAIYMTPDRELALELAQRAADTLRKPAAVDLRGTAKQLRDQAAGEPK